MRGGVSSGPLSQRYAQGPDPDLTEAYWFQFLPLKIPGIIW
jgi:hypothetical protein